MDLIIGDCSLIFFLKFLPSLCYLFEIKQKFLTAFYPQTNSQIKEQNSTMKAKFKAFVNYKWDNWVLLFPMTKFAYNNTKNASINYILFQLNYSFYYQASYKKDVYGHSQLKLADKQITKLKKLMVNDKRNLQYT